MIPAGTFTVAQDHPALPGHFPGQPIVPGVVLLDHVALCLVPPGHRLGAIDVVKFTRPVLAGETVAIMAGIAAEGRIAFACTISGEDTLRGTLRYV